MAEGDGGTGGAVEWALVILREEEDYRPWPYRCSEGFWTIGIGTQVEWPDMVAALDALEAAGQLSASPFPGQRGPGPEPWVITEVLAERLLRQRVERDHAWLGAHRMWYEPAEAERHMGPERQAIVLSMAYQMGIPRLLRFRQTIKAWWEMDFETAAREMLDSVWARRETPARAKRHSEAMRTGDLGHWIRGGGG